MFAVKKTKRHNTGKFKDPVDGKQYRSMAEYISVQTAFVRMGWPQERLRPQGKWSLPTARMIRSSGLPE